MRCFKSGGMAFYMLETGDFYPDPYADKEFIGAYVIFPCEGKWLPQIFSQGKWTDLTQQRFDTENAAFNFAYEHYLSEQKKMFPLRR